MALFLNADELQELTARKRPSAQIRWLDSNGVRYTRDAEGRPKVLRAHIDKMLGGTTRRSKTQPNSEALQRFLDG
ncbi:MAG: DUF4224 domain-containing protein [Ectothiorhodospiraceae bacterium]|nr:DUF4224 domain-containing protein [Ectothiorhodospiraceae bacterium]